MPKQVSIAQVYFFLYFFQFGNNKINAIFAFFPNFFRTMSLQKFKLYNIFNKIAFRDKKKELK